MHRGDFPALCPQQKARDNRAALRINKVQMSNDSLRRQQHPDGADPGARADMELFKDPLKQRESEHEQEWKFRQVCGVFCSVIISSSHCISA